MCLLFLGVKGKAESEWGSMFVLLSLVWWLIDSSDTVARPLARSRFFQRELVGNVLISFRLKSAFHSPF